MKKNEVLYKVEWFGRGHVLMSRNYVRDRESVKEYVDYAMERIRNERPPSTLVEGNSPESFVALDRTYSSGIKINIADRSRIETPYNDIVDKFGEARLLGPNPLR